MTRILLSSIRIDGGTQARVSIDESVVAEYSVAIGSGADFPPVVVFNDGSNRWLADGFHRYFGSVKAGAKDIEAETRFGTLQDAILYAAGANAHHGLRRTNADKRRSVLMLLEHPEGEWSQWSDRKIAEACGVTHPFVASIREPLIAEKQRADRAALREREAAEAAKVESVTTPTAAPQAAKVESVTTPPAVIPSVATAPDTSAQAPGPVTTTKPEVAAAAPAAPWEQGDAPEADDTGPSEEELAALARADAEEQEALQRLLESDNKLAHLHAENKQLRAENRVLKERLGGMQNQSNEQIRIITALRGKLKKLEQAA